MEVPKTKLGPTCFGTSSIYMEYRTLDPKYTLPYIPIRVLFHTSLQTLFTISSHHATKHARYILKLTLIILAIALIPLGSTIQPRPCPQYI